MGMSEDSTRVVHARMPLRLARAIKMAAVQNDIPVQDWLKEAAEEKLRRKEEAESAAA